MLWRALKSMPETVILTPVKLFQALMMTWREWQLKRSFSPSDGSVAGDFGARASVRELGAADQFDSYLKLLDVEKYTKIIERLLLDTVLDFLAMKGVDTSAFAASAGSVINGDVINIGSARASNMQVGRGSQMQVAPAQVVPAPAAAT